MYIYIYIYIHTYKGPDRKGLGGLAVARLRLQLAVQLLQDGGDIRLYYQYYHY